MSVCMSVLSMHIMSVCLSVSIHLLCACLCMYVSIYVFCYSLCYFSFIPISYIKNMYLIVIKNT